MRMAYLTIAMVWECPECCTDNLCRGVFVEFTKAESEAYAEHYGGDASDYRTGEWIEAPETVVCSNCQSSFEANPLWI